MNKQQLYNNLVDALLKQFGPRLKTIILFGSRSRGEARPGSDHDIFVVIDNLPVDPLARRRQVMTCLLPILPTLPEQLSIVAKTPQEVSGDLTPLLIDIGADGISLYGNTYFRDLQARVRESLRHDRLQRRRLAGTWMWMLPTFSHKEKAISEASSRERA
jgi:hypothetical protein